MEEVAFDQLVVSRKVATLHTWVAVMINTGDGKNMDNVFNGYPLHALLDPSDPRYIVDALLAESHIEASEV